MSNEKHNNWRRRLLELDSMPDQAPYDKETAWQQLQNRLQQPRRKKTYWYWAAAAVLLLVGWPLLVQKTDKSPITKVITNRPLHKSTAATPIPVVKETFTPVAIISYPPAKNTDAQVPSKPKKQIQVPVTDIVLPIAADSSNIAASIPDVGAADSAATSLSSAKTDRKLPVVHINELETAAPELSFSTAPVHVRWKTKRSLRSSASQLAAAQKDNTGIINIRLSFKN